MGETTRAATSLKVPSIARRLGADQAVSVLEISIKFAGFSECVRGCWS